MYGEIREKMAQENTKATSKSFIFAWGNDEFGQLGLGKNSYEPFYTTPRYTKYSINIKNIVCGQSHSVMKSEQGSVYVFGSNHYGQLGLPPIQSRRTPTLLPMSKKISCWHVAAGSHHTIVYTSKITGNIVYLAYRFENTYLYYLQKYVKINFSTYLTIRQKDCYSIWSK